MEDKKKNLIIVFLAILSLALLVIVIYQSPIKGKGKETSLSADEIGKKVVTYIDTNIVQGGAEVSLKKIEEVNGLYKLVLQIGDQEYTSYATKDGKLLFPQAITLTAQNEKPQKEFPKSEIPDVKLFVMSFCPFGNQAEEMLAEVAGLLKDKIKITPHYIFYSNYGSGYPDYCWDKENKYCSMHGIQELNQDIRELCVFKYQKEKFWDFVKEINQKASAQDADKKWETIATNLGIDTQKIKECQKNEGENFLKEEVGLTQKEYPSQAGGKEKIAGSPTLVINGVIYNGKRSAEDFKKAICQSFKSPPDECQKTLGENQSPPKGGSCK
jgi:hypothetical protein